ncbi:MAG: response regulator, partial [Methanobacteriota archaeon]
EQVLPDLILIDIGLKGSLDGIDVGRVVKKRFNIPFIYLTGQADPATLAKAKGTSPSGYVVKPFEDKNLKVAIEIALR